MGKQQSKQQEEQIIIAQNGAGNSAATATSEQQIYGRYELYLIFITTCILVVLSYLLWTRCKVKYARYMRRELQDVQLGETRRGMQGSNGPPSTPARIVI